MASHWSTHGFCSSYDLIFINTCVTAPTMVSAWPTHRFCFCYYLSLVNMCFCFFDGISVINTYYFSVVIPVWSGYILFSFCYDLILIIMVLAHAMTSFWFISFMLCSCDGLFIFRLHLYGYAYLCPFLDIIWLLSRYICIVDAPYTFYNIILSSVHTYMIVFHLFWTLATYMYGCSSYSMTVVMPTWLSWLIHGQSTLSRFRRSIINLAQVPNTAHRLS